MSTHTTDIDPDTILDHTDDLPTTMKETLTTTDVQTQSDAEPSTDHTTPNQPISTDHEVDIMSTTSDDLPIEVTQADETDMEVIAGEDNDLLGTVVMDEVLTKASTTISTDAQTEEPDGATTNATEMQVTADGEELAVGADAVEAITDGAVIVNAFTGLVIALAFAMLILI